VQFDLVIRNGTLVTARGQIAADLGIKDGLIAAIADRGQVPQVQEVRSLDARGLHILPGLIDAHVHLREPGWPEHEDFVSGTQAAAAGGVTTILEMPTSVPMVDSASVFTERLKKLEGRALVDYGLYGGLGETNPGAAKGLAEVGAIAFKTIRSEAPRGSDEARLGGGVRAANPATMLERFRESAPTQLPHAVHVEDQVLCEHFAAQAKARGWIRPEYHNLGRPELCEIVATVETLALARDAKARLHLVHMSSPVAVQMAGRAKADGQEVTVETCPQYLILSSDDMRRLGPFGGVHPPLRTPESRDRLWDLVNAGIVDTIGTDHAPYSAADREKQWDNIWEGPRGSPGLETLLPVLLTQVNAGRLSLERLIALTGENPARIFGLYPQKGTILPGSQADLVLVDLDDKRTLRAEEFFTKSRASARMFDGMSVQGTPVYTVVRGVVVYDHGRIVAGPGHGRFVRPN
jgi:allantoinase